VAAQPNFVSHAKHRSLEALHHSKGFRIAGHRRYYKAVYPAALGQNLQCRRESSTSQSCLPPSPIWDEGRLVRFQARPDIPADYIGVTQYLDKAWLKGKREDKVDFGISLNCSPFLSRRFSVIVHATYLDWPEWRTTVHS
jgi:hypothetical protein